VTASAQAKVPPMTSQAPSGWLIRGTKSAELGLPENTYIPFPEKVCAFQDTDPGQEERISLFHRTNGPALEVPTGR
jgi:hypothetical protein